MQKPTKLLTANEKLSKLTQDTKNTLGLKLYDHLRKEPEITDLEEISPLRDANYLQEITDVANADEHRYSGDYFVVTLLRREKLLMGKVRKQTFTRQTCPTPNYDQIVYKVHRNDRLEFIWSIPSKNDCVYYYNNRLMVKPVEYAYMQQIIDFADGTLWRKCQELNGEVPDSPFLINKPIFAVEKSPITKQIGAV